MIKLNYEGEIKLDEIFRQNKIAIHDVAVASIEKSWQDESVVEVEIVTIKINAVEYKIWISRNKYLVGLYAALKAYEEEELYEKCQSCFRLINLINENKLKP